MTCRREKPVSLRAVGLAALFAMMLPSAVFATHFELSRLASQIELISGQLAHELRYSRYYGSVRQRAVTLNREASQLVETLRRNRSDARVRSQFKDVRRGYERQEKAFFAADRRSHDPALYREVHLLSSAFTELSDEFYFAGRAAPIYTPPVVHIRSDSLIKKSRSHSRREFDTRSRSRIKPHRERAVPQVFRGNSGRFISGRAGDHDERNRNARRALSNAAAFDHRSNVLDRRGRQIEERRRVQEQGRRARTPSVEARSAPSRLLQPTRRGRGVVSETDSRNHYE